MQHRGTAGGWDYAWSWRVRFVETSSTLRCPQVSGENRSARDPQWWGRGCLLLVLLCCLCCPSCVAVFACRTVGLHVVPSFPRENNKRRRPKSPAPADSSCSPELVVRLFVEKAVRVPVPHVMRESVGIETNDRAGHGCASITPHEGIVELWCRERLAGPARIV